MIRASRFLAARAPEGRDRDHPFRVALALDGVIDTVVALLHDLVEDGFATMGEIHEEFGATVAVSVDRMTRRDGEVYADYIGRVGYDLVATRVKLADLADNLKDLPPHKESLRKRYEAAQKFLHDLTALRRNVV